MKKSALGFTLVELVVTVSLVAILVVLGAPPMRELIQNNRQAAHINEMLVSLSLARAEAVKRGAGTVVCITDGAATPDCGDASTHWEDGWIVFVDGNQTGPSAGALDDPFDADGDGLWDAGEDWLLQTHAALPGGTSLRGSTNVMRSINYNPRGFVNGFPVSSEVLTLCDDRGAEEARGIVVSNTGRARLAIDSDENGIVEGGGGDLSCP